RWDRGQTSAAPMAADVLWARSSRATSTDRCENHLHVLPASQRQTRTLTDAASRSSTNTFVTNLIATNMFVKVSVEPQPGSDPLPHPSPAKEPVRCRSPPSLMPLRLGPKSPHRPPGQPS